MWPPHLIVAQKCNKRDTYWVLHSLLVAPRPEYLDLMFDPLCNKPHMVGANIEELAK